MKSLKKYKYLIDGEFEVSSKEYNKEFFYCKI